MILPHRASPAFWVALKDLPEDAQKLAAAAYLEWTNDPRATGLRFKHVAGNIYSARIGKNYRALCYLEGDIFNWYWVGTHADYERKLRGK